MNNTSPRTKTFFIVGSQRSGTTLLATMLGNHPDILVEDSSIGFRLVGCFGLYKDVLPHNLEHNWSQIQSWLIREDYKKRLAGLIDPKEVQEGGNARVIIADAIHKRLNNSNKQVFGDKSPNLQFYVSDMLTLIPDAKFIHIIRDGRDAALSKSIRGYRNMKLAAQEWVDGNIMGLHNEAMIGKENYLMVKYEDLINAPDVTLKQICPVLNVEYSDLMLNTSNSSSGRSYVKCHLDSSGINKAISQLSHNQIKSLEKIMGPLLHRFGYALINKEFEKRYVPLTLSGKIFLNQMDSLRHLFRSKIVGMQKRALVDVRVPFRSRLKTAMLRLARDFFPDELFKKIIRRKWIKELYMPADRNDA